MSRRALNDEQVAHLVKLYPDHTNPELGRAVDVKLTLIEAYAHKMRLSKTDETRMRACGGARAWTATELAYLREHYPTGDLQVMARHLGRTPDQVQSKANKSKIKRAQTIAKAAKQENGATSAAKRKSHVAPGWASSNSANDRHARLTAEQRAALPPVGMDTAKRTVAPTFVDTRFSVAPGEKVKGAGFAALGPGRYCEDGRTWGSRA